MNRGNFNFLNTNSFYQNADKKWIITLDECHKFWYDLIVFPNQLNDKINTRTLITQKLKEIELNVKKHLDKRFIYFICSRTKIRFNIKKWILFNPISKYTYIPILIGKIKLRNILKLNSSIVLIKINVQKFIYKKILFLFFIMMAIKKLFQSMNSLI